MIKLLQGVRVLECAVLPTGDQAGRLLGDLGAEIIKIEQPGVGDYLRELGGQITPHNSPIHLMMNRHKRSLTLNLRSDEGRQIFYKLLPMVDIFIDGFAGDACARLGVGYEDQRKVKPDIIYCQASGFGSQGPYGQVPVHGYMMNAVAGGSRLRLRGDGLVEEDLGPTDLNFPGIVDGPLMGGTFGALTAIAALRYRDQTGEGVYIDASGTDATLAAQSLDATTIWNLERTTDRRNLPPTIGSDPRQRPKYGYYQTKDDKFVLVAAIEHKFWDNFCRAIGREDLMDAKYLESPVDFHDGGRADLADELAPIFRSRTLEQWVATALEFDIPLSPAHQFADVLDDPHLRAREIIHESVTPHAGPFTTIGWPAPVKDQPFDVVQHAPSLGEHTDEILAELGYMPAQIADLRELCIV
jgi:formyl-CoA transferase